MWKKIVVTAVPFGSLSVTAQTNSHLDKEFVELVPGEHSVEINGLKFTI